MARLSAQAARSAYGSHWVLRHDGDEAHLIETPGPAHRQPIEGSSDTAHGTREAASRHARENGIAIASIAPLIGTACVAEPWDVGQTVLVLDPGYIGQGILGFYSFRPTFTPGTEEPRFEVLQQVHPIDPETRDPIFEEDFMPGQLARSRDGLTVSMGAATVRLAG